MNSIQFGFCLPIFANPGAGLFRTPAFRELDTTAAMRLGRLADELGYDSLWVADHLMLGRNQAILEGWTTLAALAGMTQRARLGIIHTNNAFRHPALTAKMVATLDQISGGRTIHFIDYGNRPYEFLAYGLHHDDSREERIAQMREGLDLTLRLWTAREPLSFSGKYYTLDKAVCEPKPLQQPHPPVWIGEAYPEILEVTAAFADGWNSTPATLTELQHRLQLLRTACEHAQRDYDAITKSLEIQVLLAPDESTLRHKLKAILDLAPGESLDVTLHDFLAGTTNQLPPFIADSWIAGTPEQATQQLQAYITKGITHFLLWCIDAPDEGTLRLFADRVAPHFRA